MKNTAIIHHPIYQKHDTGFGHPETSKRYEVVMSALYWARFAMAAVSLAIALLLVWWSASEDC